MAKTANGDAHAFETLYRLYERRLYQYLRTLIHDDAAVEELVIEVMVAVWNGADRFRGASRVSTWIFGIARHKALDLLRRSARPLENPLALDDIVELADRDAADAAEHVQQKQVTALMRQALLQLSPDHQEVLRLAFFEELSYQEIADLTQVPVNTVKTRVYYAKQQLKRALEQLNQNKQSL